ncbi:ly-6/neurotoxin-like protein 1 [Nothobranchius furzeri]|uniref:Ly-6/neurotoxin-like protein 1 n=1 Tax=Nothobranchius furzeri TaxID=105023 RepID=A0A8C6M3P4_NOTFU|nr:ly-6/neurotoxin-like protein 1 [Nothobranchius furzeri]
MQLYGALILLVSISAALGLRCYVCPGAKCNYIQTCPPFFDRCASAEVRGNVVKSCFTNALCVSPVSCCDKDLCNGAGPTGPGVMLLLLSSALVTLFL